MQLQVDTKRRHALKLEDVGMTPAQMELIQEAIREPRGVVLVASPRGQGLTSSLYGIVRGHDAYMTHIHTIERNPDVDFEGVTQNKLPQNASGAEEQKMVSWVSSQQPDVIMMSQVEDPAAPRS